MSINDTIKNDLRKLYAQIINYDFSKKTYDGLFKSTFEEYRHLFKNMTIACEEVEDSKPVIDEIATIIPDIFYNELGEASSKRTKEMLIMNRNTTLVTFIIPLFRYSRDAFQEDIVDSMIEKWNENIPMKVQKATYEEITAGFKFKLCYITTAVCEHLQKPDNCYELTILRNYRDNYLMATPKGKQLVSEYYDIAPTIVKRMNASTLSHELYGNVYDQYLAPCIQAIEQGENETCRHLYENMVHSLQDTFVYERTSNYEN